MISLDQVHLLEQKVESAVAKIAQLNAENAALRSKCAELTNALTAKSEQFSSFQQDQNKIEEGILKALNRLNTVESSLLSNESESSGNQTQQQASPSPAAQTMQPQTHSAQVNGAQTSSPAQTHTVQDSAQTHTAQTSAHAQQAGSSSAAQAGTNQGQFDIF
jgi:chromosome segregation ATPase